jgi:hypothetical protein
MASLRGLARLQYADRAGPLWRGLVDAAHLFVWSVSGPQNAITQTGMAKAGGRNGTATSAGHPEITVPLRDLPDALSETQGNLTGNFGYGIFTKRSPKNAPR